MSMYKKFDGDDYQHDRDCVRLTGQLQRVYGAMKDGKWRSVKEIQTRIWLDTGKHDPETSISAQVRNLRKERYGGHQIERGRMDSGLYKFKLINTGEGNE